MSALANRNTLAALLLRSAPGRGPARARRPTGRSGCESWLGWPAVAATLKPGLSRLQDHRRRFCVFGGDSDGSWHPGGTVPERLRHAWRGCWARWTAIREADTHGAASPRPGLSRSVFTLEGCSRWCRERASSVPNACQRVEKGAEFRGPPLEQCGVVRTSDWQTRGLAFGTPVERFGAPPPLIGVIKFFVYPWYRWSAAAGLLACAAGLD